MDTLDLDTAQGFVKIQETGITKIQHAIKVGKVIYLVSFKLKYNCVISICLINVQLSRYYVHTLIICINSDQDGPFMRLEILIDIHKICTSGKNNYIFQGIILLKRSFFIIDYIFRGQFIKVLSSSNLSISKSVKWWWVSYNTNELDGQYTVGTVATFHAVMDTLDLDTA